jgi:hypothetical protein
MHALNGLRDIANIGAHFFRSRRRCGHRTYCPWVLKVLVGGLTPRSVQASEHRPGIGPIGVIGAGHMRHTPVPGHIRVVSLGIWVEPEFAHTPLGGGVSFLGHQ